MDHLGLVQAINRLGQGVVVAVALAADRWLNTGFGQPLAVTDRYVLPEFNRSSQHPNFKELQWVKRNTGGAGDVLAQPLVRLGVRGLTLEMSNGASGWRLQRVAQVRRLQLRLASRLLSERAGSGNVAACRTFPFTNLQVDTFLSTSARRLLSFEHEGGRPRHPAPAGSAMGAFGT